VRANLYYAAVAALAGLMAKAVLAAPLIVGILEERRGADLDSSRQHHLRAGFMKAASEWVVLRCKDAEEASGAVCRALATPGAQVPWTIYYRGNVLGTVKSTSWTMSDLSMHEGALAIAPGQVPAVGKPSKDFAGWMSTNAHRPLIAINSAVPPYTSRWEMGEPHPELLAAAWPAFHSVVSAVDVCEEDSDAVSIHTLRQEDVKPMRGLSSRSGELLLRFGVDPVCGRIARCGAARIYGCSAVPVEMFGFFRVRCGTRMRLPTSIRAWSPWTLAISGETAAKKRFTFSAATISTVTSFITTASGKLSASDGTITEHSALLDPGFRHDCIVHRIRNRDTSDRKKMSAIHSTVENGVCKQAVAVICSAKHQEEESV
jgi:hypothetical protein